MDNNGATTRLRRTLAQEVGRALGDLERQQAQQRKGLAAIRATQAEVEQALARIRARLEAREKAAKAPARAKARAREKPGIGPRTGARSSQAMTQRR